jgi:hypothetical protein
MNYVCQEAFLFIATQHSFPAATTKYDSCLLFILNAETVTNFCNAYVIALYFAF